MNFPEVSLPVQVNVSRILHVHKNIPGVINKINKIFADKNVNVAAQYLQTSPSIGYVVMDIHTNDPESLVNELKGIEGTLKCRVLL